MPLSIFYDFICRWLHQTGKEDNWFPTRMEGHAEGYKQAEEHPRRPARARVQPGGVHQALHVIVAFLSF